MAEQGQGGAVGPGQVLFQLAVQHLPIDVVEEVLDIGLDQMGAAGI
jgi:hypothetical protein